MKKLFGILTIALLSLGLTLPIHAQTGVTSSAEATASAVPVNSFELFWPLVAGKTEGDRFYQLKLFKEKIRGWFVFGESKKADYAVLLGTKRVLEAEKLLKDGKTDLALKTLERADSQFSSAYSHIKKADSQGKLSTGEIRRDRLIHVKRLIDYLKTVSPQETYPGLDTVKEKANMILRDYLP